MTDAVIVGAGIGGAVLALDLAQRGRTVAIVERDASPPPMIRPEALRASTAAILDRLGLASAIRRSALLPLTGADIWRGGTRFAAISESDFGEAGGAPLSTDPGALRTAILDRAVATGAVTVHRPVRVRDLQRVGDRIGGVVGERPDGARFELSGRVIVGDDGVESTVRGALGIPIDLKMFPLQFITALISWPSKLAPNRAQVWVTPQDRAAFQNHPEPPRTIQNHPEPPRTSQNLIPVVVLVPWPGGRGVCLIPLAHANADRLFGAPADVFWSEFEAVTPLATTLREQVAFPSGFGRVRRRYGHAQRYVEAGAVLLGDAAHPMSPAGGQGANAAVWDAAALAEAIDSSLGRSSALVPDIAPLAEYERRRRPANTRSLTFTLRAVTAVWLADHVPGASAVGPAFLRLAARRAGLRRALLRQSATAFVTR